MYTSAFIRVTVNWRKRVEKKTSNPDTISSPKRKVPKILA